MGRFWRRLRFKVVSAHLRRARSLVANGRHHEAITFLHRRNKRLNAPRIEVMLRDLRHEAFFHKDFGRPTGPWPPTTSDPFPATPAIPVVDRSVVSSEIIRAGVFQRGSIIVRGLLPQADVEMLATGIDRAYEAHGRHLAGAPTSSTSPWFSPFQPADRYVTDREIGREWFRQTFAELAADSPRNLYRLIEVFRSNGIIDLVEGFLGERPALSVKKTSLRDIPFDLQAANGWHQDGAFLGEGIRTLNCWVALSDCGVDAPSMDMVPRRLNSILPIGTEGAEFNWSVSQAVAEEACAPDGFTHLEFTAGDAIFFDEMNLHRSSALPGMTRNRKAIEAWFFAPSCYPIEQFPILV